LTAAALTALAVTDLHGPPVVTVSLLVLLLIGCGAVIAVLSPYTAEVYPTRIRGLGTGMAAACSKAGGIFGPPALAGLLVLVPGARLVGIVAALPMAIATIAIARQGVETRGRALEEIQPAPAAAAASMASEPDQAA
jgi:putative MFS transporter